MLYTVTVTVQDQGRIKALGGLEHKGDDGGLKGALWVTLLGKCLRDHAL